MEALPKTQVFPSTASLSKVDRSQTREDVHAFSPRNPLVDLGLSGVSLDHPAFQDIQNAESVLERNGFSFVGYHGTNMENFRNMHTGGLDPKFCGSGAGECRGSGFYVAHAPTLAVDFADQATQSGDPVMDKAGTFVQPRHPPETDKGRAVLTRVYVKNFDGLKTGKDVVWGAGLGPQPAKPRDTHDGLSGNVRSLELVIAPEQYGAVALLPSLYPHKDESALSPVAPWPSQEYHGERHRDPGTMRLASRI